MTLTGTVPASTQPTLTTLVEYDASNNPIYVGDARPGTAESANGWRIKKVTYDASNNPTDIEWAEGTTNFDKVWDDRGIYAYS